MTIRYFRELFAVIFLSLCGIIILSGCAEPTPRSSFSQVAEKPMPRSSFYQVAEEAQQFQLSDIPEKPRYDGFSGRGTSQVWITGPDSITIERKIIRRTVIDLLRSEKLGYTFRSNVEGVVAPENRWIIRPEFKDASYLGPYLFARDWRSVGADNALWRVSMLDGSKEKTAYEGFAYEGLLRSGSLVTAYEGSQDIGDEQNPRQRTTISLLDEGANVIATIDGVEREPLRAKFGVIDRHRLQTDTGRRGTGKVRGYRKPTMERWGNYIAFQKVDRALPSAYEFYDVEDGSKRVAPAGGSYLVGTMHRRSTNLSKDEMDGRYTENLLGDWINQAFVSRERRVVPGNGPQLGTWLVHPVNFDGNLLPLPPGVLGLIPISWGNRSADDDSLSVIGQGYNLQRIHGWIVVHNEGGTETYSMVMDDMFRALDPRRYGDRYAAIEFFRFPPNLGPFHNYLKPAAVQRVADGQWEVLGLGHRYDQRHNFKQVIFRPSGDSARQVEVTKVAFTQYISDLNVAEKQRLAKAAAEQARQKAEILAWERAAAAHQVKLDEERRQADEHSRQTINRLIEKGDWEGAWKYATSYSSAFHPPGTPTQDFRHELQRLMPLHVKQRLFPGDYETKHLTRKQPTVYSSSRPNESYSNFVNRLEQENWQREYNRYSRQGLGR